ncbi:MAG TPA: glycine oxidase ThiO [Planctomycetota bacterium]|nr:glycine oxidase ThiO [Planctomycetota bacterium]
MARNPDVIVVGAGIIGSAIAYELAKEGRRVVLFDKGPVGRGASWAAAGLLTPIHLAEYPAPLASLCIESERMYESWVQGLGAPEVEYCASGLILMVFDDQDERDAAALETWKKERGSEVLRLDPQQLHHLEQAASTEVRRALLFPDVAQVRNHRLTRALSEAARKLDAEIRPETEVTGFLKVPGRINGVRTSRGDLFAAETIVAAGAWSGDLDVGAEVRPVRGQMVLLEGPSDGLTRVLLARDAYLVPRMDGRILLGSTLEENEHEATTTADAISFLLDQGLRIAPGIARFKVAATWAGLRPATKDRLPYIGRPAGVEGLILATGHFRNGILLAPVTAKIVSELVGGRPQSIDLAPFRPGR